MNDSNNVCLTVIFAESISFHAKAKMKLIFKCYFLRRSHSTEQTPFTRVIPSGYHFTAESTEAMRNKCLAQGHNIVMPSGYVFNSQRMHS